MTLGWADHEEVVTEITESREFFRQQAIEWNREALEAQEEVRQLREAAALASEIQLDMNRLLHSSLFGWNANQKVPIPLGELDDLVRFLSEVLIGYKKN